MGLEHQHPSHIGPLALLAQSASCGSDGEMVALLRFRKRHAPLQGEREVNGVGSSGVGKSCRMGVAEGLAVCLETSPLSVCLSLSVCVWVCPHVCPSDKVCVSSPCVSV